MIFNYIWYYDYGEKKVRFILGSSNQYAFASLVYKLMEKWFRKQIKNRRVIKASTGSSKYWKL